ncbi:hypothetical protein HDU96_010341 [Phlyctochytrium bullatum]|nr:hypothetical protein HDU96_010341 [Phlyctochytrium bullatum]
MLSTYTYADAPAMALADHHHHQPWTAATDAFSLQTPATATSAEEDDDDDVLPGWGPPGAKAIALSDTDIVDSLFLPTDTQNRLLPLEDRHDNAPVYGEDLPPRKSSLAWSENGNVLTSFQNEMLNRDDSGEGWVEPPPRPPPRNHSFKELNHAITVRATNITTTAPHATYVFPQPAADAVHMPIGLNGRSMMEFGSSEEVMVGPATGSPPAFHASSSPSPPLSPNSIQSPAAAPPTRFPLLPPPRSHSVPAAGLSSVTSPTPSPVPAASKPKLNHPPCPPALTPLFIPPRHNEMTHSATLNFLQVEAPVAPVASPPPVETPSPSPMLSEPAGPTAHLLRQQVQQMQQQQPPVQTIPQPSFPTANPTTKAVPPPPPRTITPDEKPARPRPTRVMAVQNDDDDLDFLLPRETPAELVAQRAVLRPRARKPTTTTTHPLSSPSSPIDGPTSPTEPHDDLHRIGRRRRHGQRERGGTITLGSLKLKKLDLTTIIKPRGRDGPVSPSPEHPAPTPSSAAAATAAARARAAFAIRRHHRADRTHKQYFSDGDDGDFDDSDDDEAFAVVPPPAPGPARSRAHTTVAGPGPGAPGGWDPATAYEALADDDDDARNPYTQQRAVLRPRPRRPSAPAAVEILTFSVPPPPRSLPPPALALAAAHAAAAAAAVGNAVPPPPGPATGLGRAGSQRGNPGTSSAAILLSPRSSSTVDFRGPPIAADIEPQRAAPEPPAPTAAAPRASLPAPQQSVKEILERVAAARAAAAGVAGSHVRGLGERSLSFGSLGDAPPGPTAGGLGHRRRPSGPASFSTGADDAERLRIPSRSQSLAMRGGGGGGGGGGNGGGGTSKMAVAASLRAAAAARGAAAHAPLTMHPHVPTLTAGPAVVAPAASGVVVPVALGVGAGNVARSRKAGVGGGSATAGKSFVLQAEQVRNSVVLGRE